MLGPVLQTSCHAHSLRHLWVGGKRDRRMRGLGEEDKSQTTLNCRNGAVNVVCKLFFVTVIRNFMISGWQSEIVSVSAINQKVLVTQSRRMLLSRLSLVHRIWKKKWSVVFSRFRETVGFYQLASRSLRSTSSLHLQSRYLSIKIFAPTKACFVVFSRFREKVGLSGWLVHYWSFIEVNIFSTSPKQIFIHEDLRSD